MARGIPTNTWWQAAGNSVADRLGRSPRWARSLFVAYQVSQIEVNSRKANARQVYLAYSNAGLSYPELLRPTDYVSVRRRRHTSRALQVVHHDDDLRL